MFFSQWWSLRTAQLILTRLAVFCASFDIIRLPGKPLTLADMLFTCALLLIIVTGRLQRHPFGSATNVVFILFGLMSFGIVVSGLFASVADEALFTVMQYALAYLVLGYIISAEDYKTVVNLIKWYLAGVTLGMLIPLYWYFYEPTPNLFVSGNGRFMAIVGSSNGQAAVIALSLPYVYYLLMRGYWSRWLLLLISLVLLYSLIATSSNNGLLATTIASFVFFILTLSLTRMAKVFCVMLVMVPLFLKFGIEYLPETFRERVLAGVESGELEQVGTYAARVALIKEAVEMLDETIILGVGADQFRNVSHHGHPVHNTYLLLWTEDGLITSVAWTSLFITFTIMGLAMWRTPTGWLEGALATTCSVTMLFVALSTTYGYPRSWSLPVILSIGLVVTLQRLQAASPTSRRSGVRPAIASMAAHSSNIYKVGAWRIKPR